MHHILKPYLSVEEINRIALFSYLGYIILFYSFFKFCHFKQEKRKERNPKSQVFTIPLFFASDLIMTPNYYGKIFLTGTSNCEAVSGHLQNLLS